MGTEEIEDGDESGESSPGYSAEDTEDGGGWTRQDEFLEAFGSGSNTPIVVDPKDGLPRPADGIVATAPSFSLARFVCAEDDSVFVEVFGEEVSESDYRRLPFAFRSKYDLEGRPNERRKWERENVTVEDRFGFSVVRDKERWVHVRPARPRCDFFVQQLDEDDSIDKGGVAPLVHSPYCKKMLSNSGAMMSLRDQNVVACTERSPRDIVSLSRITAFNKRQREAAERREMVPLIAPVEHRDVSDGTEDYPMLTVAIVDCDPKVAPGKQAKLFLLDPAELMSNIRGGAKIKEVLVAGADWFPAAEELGAHHSMGYHNLRLYDSDYAPSGVSSAVLEEFCSVWPRNARFEYASANLRSTPQHLARRMLNGDDVYVTGKTKELARFGAELILMYLGFPSSGFEFQRPEHRAYLDRMFAEMEKTHG